MQILGLLGMYFDAVVVELKKNSLLFKLTLAIELMINKARHEIRMVNTARWP